jgi:signal peptidase II
MLNDRQKTTALFAAVVFLVTLDRILKAWAVNFRPEITLLGDWFRIVSAGNQGIAFSLPLFGQFIITVIIIIIIALIYFLVVKLKKAAYFESVFYSAIILGAASNLYDRFKFGYVIDYFSLKYYSVFNLADGLILFGAIWIVLHSLDRKSR